MQSLILIVRTREHTVAVDGELVREIVALPLLRKVPSGHPAFAGLLNFRGETVPVYNLGKLLWNEPVPLTKDASLLIVQVDGHLAGFVIDEVLSAVDATSGSLEDVDGLYSLIPGVTKVFKQGADVTPVLDLRRLVDTRALSFEVESLDELEYAALGQEVDAESFEVLRERSERLAVRYEEEEEDDEHIGLLVVRLGNEHYGLRIEQVSEIMRPQPVTMVPGAPREIEGVVAVRGEIVPIVNMGSFVLDRPSGGEESERFVLISTEDGLVGLRVDEVVSLTFVRERSVESPISHDERLSRILVGEVYIDERLVSILEPTFNAATEVAKEA